MARVLDAHDLPFARGSLRGIVMANVLTGETFGQAAVGAATQA